MSKSPVSIVRYEEPIESTRRAVELSHGLDHLPAKAKVFIKPNIVFWTIATNFPKWGVITTSRVIEDMVVLLKERGIDDITIGEGMVMSRIRDTDIPAHAFKALGYNTLKKRYGVKAINAFDSEPVVVDLGDGIELNFCAEIINSDFVVNLPAMKSHNQTVVSLGIKNLKGMIDTESRKICHNADPDRDLNFHIARLADKMPPMFTLLDGIYTLEKGPSIDGRMRRSNILVASSDVLSADLVGSKILGHDPANVPHLVNAAVNRNRPHDLSDVKIVGEQIEDIASFHKFDFEYVDDESGCMPVALAKRDIKGLFYRKFDLSMCTYCSAINGTLLTALMLAYKGKPYDRLEVLTGKMMKPTPGMNKTILLGKCMCDANKDHPHINEMIPIRGCPPQSKSIIKALQKAGVEIDPAFFEGSEKGPGLLMSRYEGKPEFDESFFSVA